MVVIRRRSRCRSKQELMRGEALTLVGLEHVVSPTIDLDEIQIWLHRTRRIINIPEFRFRRAWLRMLSVLKAPHKRSPIHRAGAVHVQIAHTNEGGVGVLKI